MEREVGVGGRRKKEINKEIPAGFYPGLEETPKTMQSSDHSEAISY